MHSPSESLSAPDSSSPRPPSTEPALASDLTNSLARSFVRAELETSKSIDSMATWLLAVIGATLALFVGNLSDIIVVIGISATKASASVLIAAGLCGLAEKYLFMQLGQSLQAFDKFIELVSSPGAGNPLSRVNLSSQQLDLAAAESYAVTKLIAIFPQLPKKVSALRKNPLETEKKAILALRRQKIWLAAELSAYVGAMILIVFSISTVHL